MTAAGDKSRSLLGGTFRARLGIVSLFIILLAPVLLFWLTKRAKSSADQRNANNGQIRTTEGAGAIAPETIKIGRGSFEKKLILSGELRAVRSRAVFAQTSGESKITYLPPEGSLVKAGERVLELDSSTAVNKIKDAREKIVAAENEMLKTQSTGESALREMDIKLSQLSLVYEQAKLDAAIPASLEDRRKYQENQLNLAKAKAGYESQLTRIEDTKKEQAAELKAKTIQKQKLEIELNQANHDLAGMNVTAPAEGMVIYSNHYAERRKIQIGDVVWGGFPVISLPDLSEMEVLARVNEVDGPKLSVGQKASIRLDSYPDTQITGSVKEISQTAVKSNFMSKSRVFNVVISLDKTEPEIMKPGMSAQVTVGIADFRNELLVPRSAVRFGEGGSAEVIRVEGESKRPRVVAVTIKGSDPVSYAVADNGVLKEGDRIVK